MMSAPLVAFVGLIYLYIAAEQAIMDNPGVAILYGGYALANVGAWMLMK